MMCSQSRAAEGKWILYNDVMQYQDDLDPLRVVKLMMYLWFFPKGLLAIL